MSGFSSEPPQLQKKYIQVYGHTRDSQHIYEGAKEVLKIPLLINRKYGLRNK